MNNELLQKVSEHEGVAAIRNIISPMLNGPGIIGGRSICLAGGAIVDILEGRIPKDYDIVNASRNKAFIELLRDAGFDFVTDSTTAITYKRNDMVIQLLKMDIHSFEYTISQSSYYFATNTLTIDEDAWKKKILIPTSYRPYMAKNCLLRLPHWKMKGYDLPEITYFSLVNATGKSNGYDNSRWDSGRPAYIS